MRARRALSSLVRQYLQHAPSERGTTLLRRWTSPWLVARLATGPWIRVSGVSCFEWAVFEGRESPEAKTLAAFLALLRPGATVLDVGANIGLYTLSVAARVGPQGHVLAFEPDPAAARRLRENVALNAFGNVTVVEAAATDACGTLPLHRAGDSECSSLFDSGLAASASAVRVTTIDTEVERAGLARVDLLKLDVEGAELHALRGAQRLLTGPDPPPLLVEANPITLRAAGASALALRRLLESFAYRITVVERIAWGGDWTENWLAVRSGA